MLPDCILKMVRDTYPELDGKYTGYSFKWLGNTLFHINNYLR